MGGVSNAVNDKKNYLPTINGNDEHILSSTIVDASICFFSMENPLNWNNVNWEVIKKGIFHHSGVILEMNDARFVLFEYGGYPIENENNNGYYYPLGNGLRYSLIDEEEIAQLVENGKLFILSSERLIRYNFWCVIVKVRNQMTLNELIQRLGDGWKKDNYNLLFHNCQDFTIRVIRELNIESKYTHWYNRRMREYPIIKFFLYYSAKIYTVPRELANRLTNYYEDD